MPRKMTLPIRRLLHLDRETAAAIEAYRISQDTNTAEATRMLIHRALIDLGYLEPEES